MYMSTCTSAHSATVPSGKGCDSGVGPLVWTGNHGSFCCIMDLPKEIARGSERYAKGSKTRPEGGLGRAWGVFRPLLMRGSKKETPKTGLAEFFWGVFLGSFWGRV